MTLVMKNLCAEKIASGTFGGEASICGVTAPPCLNVATCLRPPHWNKHVAIRTLATHSSRHDRMYPHSQMWRRSWVQSCQDRRIELVTPVF